MDQDMTQEEREALHQALLNAFPTSGSLEQMVSFKLGKNLHVIAGGNNHSEVVFHLIQWAEASTTIPRLISAARKDNPGNAKLRAFEQGYNMRHQPQDHAGAQSVQL